MNENPEQTPADNIFVVTPVANEENSIAKTIHDVFALRYPTLTFCPVIDRFSKDRTFEILKDRKKYYGERLQIVYYKQSTGVASCYLYGFNYALKCGASAIVEMDAG
jgi:dolichol-phosphate mannosyltransferase